MNWEDPIVSEVRKVRESLSAKFDYDLAAIFADMRARQSSAGSRLVNLERERGKQAEAAERVKAG
jgi:hypothetical protein